MKVIVEKPLANAQVIARINELEKQFNESNHKNLELMNEISEIKNKYNWYDQPFIENGKYGIKNILGEIIVPAKFDNYVELLHYDFRRKAIPMLLGKHTVLVKTDGSGDIIPNTEYDSIRYAMYTPYYSMMRNGKIGFIYPDGTILIDCICDRYWEPLNGISVYASGNKYGVFDNNGNVTAAIFDEFVDADLDDFVKVKVGNEIGYIDNTGNFTTNEEDAFWMATI